MKVFLGRVFLVVGSSFSSLRVCCIIPFWFVDFLLRNQLIMLWEFPCVCLFFPLVAFNNLSLSLIFVTLITVCLGMFFLGFILTGPLSVSQTWLTISFPLLGMFSAITSSSIFSGPFSVFSFYNANIGVFNVVPDVSQAVFISFHSFFLYSVLWQ